MTEITPSAFRAYLAHHKHGLGILDDQLIAGVGGGAIKRLAAWAPFLAERGVECERQSLGWVEVGGATAYRDVALPTTKRAFSSGNRS